MDWEIRLKNEEKSNRFLAGTIELGYEFRIRESLMIFYKESGLLK